MIELLIAGAACAWLCKRGGDASQRAANSVTRSLKHGARDVAAKAETVLQPCAFGRAPHKRYTDGTTYSDGTLAYCCKVCGKDMP